jgi:hypothetical protein
MDWPDNALWGARLMLDIKFSDDIVPVGTGTARM